MSETATIETDMSALSLENASLFPKGIPDPDSVGKSTASEFPAV
jgi:hypothetical protein